LVKAKIKVCVEPGLQIKQSQGMTRGKNDKVDARRIVQYAYKNKEQLTYWAPQRPALQKLKALLILRERLIKTKNQLETPITESKNFIEEPLRKSISRRCTNSIAAIKKDIKNVDQDIRSLIKEDSPIQQQMKWATSVPGVGKITAANIIIATDEFQRISEVKKFACYAGVAPFEHSSGSSIRGKTRVSKMANMRIKTLLTLGSMSAVQSNPELRSYFERKISQGKNYWSVINSVRNKLISRVFACVKNQKMYQKEYTYMLA
jgi:transposase